MKTIKKHIIGSWMFLLTTLVAILPVSCIKDNILASAGDEVTVKLKVTSGSTRAGNDELVQNEDNKFSSLAVLIFDGNQCVYSMLSNPWTEGVESYSREFVCPDGSDNMYIIANYAAYDDAFNAYLRQESEKILLSDLKKQVATVNDNSLTVTGNFDPQKILMVGEKTIPPFVSGETHKDIQVELERLAARVDLFVYQEEGWNATIQVNEFSLINQVRKTYADVAGEMAPVSSEEYFAVTEVVGQTVGTEVPPAGDIPESISPLSSIYSYKTISTITGSNPAKLKISATVNGRNRVYEGFVNSVGEEAVELQNNKVYRVKAILKKEGGVIITTSVNPWIYEGDFDVNFEDNLNYISYGWTEGTYEVWDKSTNTVKLSAEKEAELTFSIPTPENGVTWSANLTDNVHFVLVNAEGDNVSDSNSPAIQRLIVKQADDGDTGYYTAQLHVYAQIGGGNRYELDMTTSSGSPIEPGEGVQTFTITRGNQ